MSQSSSIQFKFDRSIIWNGFLFFVNKLSKCTISFILFSKLTLQDFSAWANVFGMAFILALWLDFGFRRSIPLFSPYFAQNDSTKKKFLISIIAFKFLCALLVNIAWFFCCKPLAQMLSMSSHTNFFYMGSLIFLLESISSCIKLIFHSFFWQKELTIIETTIIALETLCIFFLSFSLQSSSLLLFSVFSCEIASQLLSIILLSISLLRLNKTLPIKEQATDDNTALLFRKFVKHSLIMWVFIVINSLTERNFLVPFITFFFGPYCSSMFKLANDSALIFQRFIIKTIGFSDTALLVHLELGEEVDKEEQSLKGFNLISRRVCLLTLPLFGILLIFYRGFLPIIDLSPNNQILFSLFFILSLFYLSQLLFIGYDRFLEIKKEYRGLFFSSIPYIIILIMFIGSFFYQEKINPIFLLPFIFFIHFIRFLSSTIRIYFATKSYKARFPIFFAIKILSFTFIISLIVQEIISVLLSKKFIFEVARLLFPF